MTGATGLVSAVVMTKLLERLEDAHDEPFGLVTLGFIGEGEAGPVRGGDGLSVRSGRQATALGHGRILLHPLSLIIG